MINTTHQQFDTPPSHPACEPASELANHDSGLAELSASLMEKWSKSFATCSWLDNIDILHDIGRRVVEQESQTGPIPGHNWVVVRMNANGDNQEMQELRHDGALESHNSPRCSKCMTSTLKHMMEMWMGVIGFAHHSELVFVVAPTWKDFHNLQSDAAVIKDVNIVAMVRHVWYAPISCLQVELYASMYKIDLLLWLCCCFDLVALTLSLRPCCFDFGFVVLADLLHIASGPARKASDRRDVARHHVAVRLPHFVVQLVRRGALSADLASTVMLCGQHS